MIERIRIGVVGCGSVAECAYLPALKFRESEKNAVLRVTALCDHHMEKTGKRVERVAEKFNIGE